MQDWELGLRELLSKDAGGGQCKERDKKACCSSDVEKHWNVLLGLWPSSRANRKKYKDTDTDSQH